MMSPDTKIDLCSLSIRVQLSICACTENAFRKAFNSKSPDNVNIHRAGTIDCLLRATRKSGLWSLRVVFGCLLREP